MKYGFLFGAGAETAYKLPLGGRFALEIFRQDTIEPKNDFKMMPVSILFSTWTEETYTSLCICRLS